MRYLQAIAAMALIGVLMSVYLTMFKLGLVGSLQCGGSGSCEIVQLGPFGSLFGVPVAAYGIAGYLVILVTAIVGLQPKWERRPEPTRAIVALGAGGVLFSAYLTYLEIFRIHAICRWCAGSAVLITLILVTAAVAAKRGTGQPRP